MIRRHELDRLGIVTGVVLMEPSSKLADRFFCLEQSVSGVRTEGNNYFGPDSLELPLQERKTFRYLIRLRIAVTGRSTFQNIAYKDILAPEAHSVDYLFEKLSGPPYERTALSVFIGPGRFAHENQLSIRVAFAGDRIRPRFAKAALAAFPDLFSYVFKFHPSLLVLTIRSFVRLAADLALRAMPLNRKIARKEHLHLEMLLQSLFCADIFIHSIAKSTLDRRQ